MSISPRHTRTAFTLIEFLAASAVFGLITVALTLYTSTSARMIARNLSTNHSHENIRISSQRLLDTLHDSASRFVLVNFDGTNYSDATYSATSDTDTFTGKYISTRANGVRFYQLGGGPYKLTASTIATDTDLQFDFGVDGAVPYQPIVGDRLVIPLISREFQITSVLVTPTPASTTGSVRINLSAGIGFKLTTGSGYNTTAYFYRKSAFTVYNNELRFHPTFEGTARSSYTVVRNDVTSPKPFSLLFDTATSPSSDQLKLRMSLETNDSRYNAQRFKSSTTTLVGVVPPRNVPPQVNNTN